MAKKSSMFSRGLRRGNTTVDILFMIEEIGSNGTLVTTDKLLREVETHSTSYARLKEMARFHLKIQGGVELWLLEDGCPSPINVGLDDPISKVITKDSKLQVERLGAYDQGYLATAAGAIDISDSNIPVATLVASCTAQDLLPRATAPIESGDEEIARLLSMELNGMNFKQKEKKPLHIFASNKRPPRPLGKLVAQASCSQFSMEGGRSACTSICVYAAAQLLYRISETPSCITTNVLDGYLEYGTSIYNNVYLHQGDPHSSVDDLWNLPAYSDMVRSLFRGTPISGTTSQNSFLDALMIALSYAASQEERSVALVVTKPPETVLMVCKDVFRSAPWFLFDSHGHDYDYPKRAYVMQLDTVEMAAAALLRKFPNVTGLGNSLHAQQMNMFEAHAIVRKQMHEKDCFEEDHLQLETALALSACDGVPFEVYELQHPSAEVSDFDTAESFLEECCLEHEQGNNQQSGQLQEEATKSEIGPDPELPVAAIADTYVHAKMITPTDSKAQQKSQLQEEATKSEIGPDPELPVAAIADTCVHAEMITPTDNEAQQKSQLQEKVTKAEVGSDPELLVSATADTHLPADMDNTAHASSSRSPLPLVLEATPCREPAGVTANAAEPMTAQQRSRTLQDTELVRDPITGMLFADPVFCDKGHTHERSSIESHFRARREMKADEEERIRAEQGGASAREDSCGAGRNFDPTCPLTGEPISEILINNDQCDRMVPLLVEAGFIPLEDGELEEWKERRKEKTRLAVERSAQDDSQAESSPVAQQQGQESSQEEPRPPAEVNIDANTVRIQHPLRACSPSGHFNLGVAVAVCPSDWEQSAPTLVQIPRCSNSCCRTRLRKSNRGTCARCTQMLCNNCLVFHVEEIDRTGAGASDKTKQEHTICPECVLQISNVLGAGSDPESDSNESQLVKELDETMRQFFVSLKDRKSNLQHQVTHYNKHQRFSTSADRLSQQISELQRTRDSLESQIGQAREQAEAARRDQNGLISQATEVASESPTPEEMRLQTRIADLQSEYATIDWTTEDGMMEGSLIEHQLNETMEKLAIANSSRTQTPGSSEQTAALAKSTELITSLESRCATVVAKHDALLAKGPSNEHDHKHVIKVTQLMDEFERLSMELVQAYEDHENEEIKAAAISARSSSSSCAGSDPPGVNLNRIVTSIAQFVISPFASAHSGTASGPTAQTTTQQETQDASSHDVGSSNAPLPSLNAASVEIAISDLAAIGIIGIEEVVELPLDLHYPSTQIRNQVLVLRNDMELARLESERALDEDYGSRRQQLQARVESLEDDLVRMRREVASAQATAEEEERLHQERVARREAAERERQRLARERAAEAERLRREQERLEAARRQQETDTRKSLQGLDLRKCGNPSCGYGPFEKFNCNDMAAHNDTFTFIDVNGRRQQRKRNECPQCRWTNSDWKAWPRFNA